MFASKCTHLQELQNIPVVNIGNDYVGDVGNNPDHYNTSVCFLSIEEKECARKFNDQPRTLQKKVSQLYGPVVRNGLCDSAAMVYQVATE